NVIRLETAERVSEFLENPLAHRIAFHFATCPVDADFGGQDNALSATVLVQRLAHDLFGTPLTIDGSGIDQIDALIECRVNSANGLFLIGSAPHPAADGPGAERDSG